MSRRPQELNRASAQKEEYNLVLRTEQRFRAMLSNPGVTVPSSRTEMHSQVAELVGRIRQLEASCRQPHTQDLIDALSETRARFKLLRCRLFRINELPMEVLHRIFLLTVSSQSPVEMSRSRILLSSVCSYWRSATINLARLWSVIPVTTGPPFPMFHLCLQRAKGHPLVLLIDQRNHNWSGSEAHHRIRPDDMRALMLKTASFLDQVLKLVIFADTWVEVLAAQEILQSVPPPRLLRCLEIHRSGNTYVQFLAPATPPSGFQTPFRPFGGHPAPRLEQLVLEGLYVDFARSSFRNLRVFEMRKMPVEYMPTVRNFLPVLQGSPRLEKLVFDAACPQMSGSAHGEDWQPVQLPHLSELTISSLIPDYAIYALQLFSAPRLKRLILENLLGEDYSLLIEKLVGRFPRVTVLTANGLASNNVELLVAWLRTMPVRYLKVARVPDQFFEAFLARVSEFPADSSRREPRRHFVCPQLEACEVLAWSTLKPEVFKKFCAGRKETLQAILLTREEFATVTQSDKSWLANTGRLRQILLGVRLDLSQRYEN